MPLPKKFRLSSSYLIDTAYKKGFCVKSPFFRIWYRKTSFPFRAVFIVSKKIDTRAVIRNSLKRKVSAVFFTFQDLWKEKKGNMVISIFEGTKTASFLQLQQAMKKTIKNAFE